AFVVVLVMAVVMTAGVLSWSKSWMIGLAFTLVPVVAVIASLLDTVRGYVLTDEEIRIKQLGWGMRLPLEGLLSVTGSGATTPRWFRVFGGGALFSYTGFYWNRDLGLYRAFATDPSRAVILKYAKRRIVITPHDPQKFIMQARMRLKNRQPVVSLDE